MKQLFKWIVVSLLVIILLMSFEACTDRDVENAVAVKVAVLKGPTGMGMVKLMEDNANHQENVKYEFIVSGAPDELIGKVVNGEVDMAALPTNMAATLYQKTHGQIQLTAVNTLGVLYIVENGTEINSINDLKGKKMYASGKGATPDYALRYILKQNGIDPEKDIEVDFSVQHAEVAATFAAGDAPIALLPQPHVTSALMKNKNARIALDLTEEWEKAAKGTSQLAVGCMVVQKDFAQKHEPVLSQFLQQYEQSVEWVNANAAEAGILIEKHGILPNAKLAETALPKCNIVFMDANESKDLLNGFYKVLFDFNPASVGGKIPDEAFYYSPQE